MKLVGLIGTAVLSMTLGAVAPAYAQQEQHDQQEQKAKPEEQKAKPAQQEEKKAEPAKQEEKPSAQRQKNAKPEPKNAKPEQKNAQQQRNDKPAEKNAQEQHSQQAKPVQQAQRGGGRIPDDRFKASFGQDHRFRVNQADYRNHRFQYGGYSFGFVDPWPSNWLYTQDVYVVDIGGMYYLCNPMYPGVNLALSFTL
jgi:hypothetical protein